VLFFIDDVQVKRDLHFILGQLNGGDGVSGTGLFFQGEEIRGHDPAGGLFGIGQLLLDIHRVLFFHQLEQGVLDLLFEEGDQGGGIVRRHLLQDGSDPGGFQFREQFNRDFGFDLAENGGQPVRLHFAVHEEFQDDAAFLAGKLFDERGHVGFVQLDEGVPQVPQCTEADELLGEAQKFIQCRLFHESVLYPHLRGTARRNPKCPAIMCVFSPRGR